MNIATLISFILGAALLMLIRYMIKQSNSMQRTIDSQQETIQRLINREPVTYAETGQTPQRPEKWRFAAWGNEMVNLNEDRQ